MASIVYRLIALRPIKYLILIYIMTSIAALIEMFGALTAAYSVLSGEYLESYFYLNGLSDRLILVSIIIFCVLALILRLFAIHCEKYYANLYRLEMSEKIISDLWAGPYSTLSGKNNSELIKSLTTDVDLIISYAVDPVISVGSAITSTLIIAFFLIAFDPFTTLIAIGALVVYFSFLTLLSKNNLQVLGEKSEEMLKKRQLFVQHIFSDIRSFKSKPIDQQAISELSVANSKFSLYASFSNDISQFPRLFLETIILGFLISIVLLTQGDATTNTFSKLIVFGIAGLRLLPTSQRLFTAYAHLNYSRKFLIEYEKLTEKNRKILSHASHHLEIKSIECENCQIFKHDDTILNVNNFKIEAGQTVAITGHSGSGKTTFVDTLIGLHENYVGTVLLDGLKRAENKLISTGYLTQKPNLPVGLIRDIFQSKIDINLIEEELKLLNLSKMNRKTYIGEFARNISGGEQQRLAVIKSVNDPCSLRVFDESFNAVSESMRSKVFEFIKSKSKNEMVIIITHDEEIASLCDIQYKIIEDQLVNMGKV